MPRPDGGRPRQLVVFGVPLAIVTTEDVVERIVGAAVERTGLSVFFANAHTLNTAWEHATFCDVLNRGDLVLNDGIGVRFAARLAGLTSLVNQNGTDLVPLVCESAGDHALRLFWFGGHPDRARLAGETMARRSPGLRFVGHQHGYVEQSDSGDVCEHIRASEADLVLVSLGHPLQEEWVDRYGRELGGAVAIAVGGLVDHMSGNLRRAPVGVRRLGLEWAFRMVQQPWVWRRYVVGIPKFLSRIVRDRPRVTWTESPG